jgi:hypothetical protein
MTERASRDPTLGFSVFNRLWIRESPPGVWPDKFSGKFSRPGKPMMVGLPRPDMPRSCKISA